MRAALIQTIGEPPVVGDVPEPERGKGQALIEVTAAAVNPIDISISTGRFYGGSPDVPYVMGREAVGRVIEGDSLEPGTEVWFQPVGGAFAERALADEQQAIPLPGGTDHELAAALGIAGLTGWLAVEWRAKVTGGENVLVLGATGVVGLVAVQAAKALGAAHIVAAGRDADALEAAREAGADAVAPLGDGFAEAAPGPFDVIIDPLWGEALEAAIPAAARFARIVQLGQSAGPEATLRSGDVRGKSLSILGFTLGHVPQEVMSAAYPRLLADVKVGYEAIPLDSAADAWRRQQDSPHRKLVLVP